MANRYISLIAFIFISSFGLVSCSSSDGGITSALQQSQQSEQSEQSEQQPITNLSNDDDQPVVLVPIGRLDPSLIPDDIEPEPELNIRFSGPDTNTLTDKQIDEAPPATVDEIHTAYEAVLEANPDLPVSSNEFALLIIEFLKTSVPLERNVRNVFPRIDLIFLVAKPEQKRLLLANTKYIAPTRNSMIQATSRTSLEIYGIVDPPWKDRGDAFRHSYWNWLLSDCCGLEWAEAFATAHESTSPNDDDKRMDLHNNGVGRWVYSRNPAASSAEARRNIMELNVRYVNEALQNVVVDLNSSTLVYLLPHQAVTVFDDGPAFDDVYGITIAGFSAESTPLGGSRTYEFYSLTSGLHRFEFACEEDNTGDGCGFKYAIQGAMKNEAGERFTSQIVISNGDTHTEFFRFPTLGEDFIDSLGEPVPVFAQ